MQNDTNLPIEQSLCTPVDEQKTRLWALSYENKSRVVSCCKCGSPNTVNLLEESAGSAPHRHLKDLLAWAGENRSQLIDDRYRVIRTLGQGGMGSVYLVHDQNLDKEMAIKMLRSDLGEGQESAAQRFEREAKAAMEMTHVNVAAAYCQGRNQSGEPYLVMEYVEGESLAALLAREGALELARALPLLLQVCDALVHAHTKGLVHRDIKPANILLKSPENEEKNAAGHVVKLVDFGIAKNIPAFDLDTRLLTATGEIIGSPAYMSPEHCQGGECDERSDIYAFGCVMYETLTGRPPFTSKNPVMVIIEHVKNMPARCTSKFRLSDSPLMPEKFDFGSYRQAVEDVLMRCLEKEPSHRYSSADDLRLDLEALSQFRVPGARPGLPAPAREREAALEARKKQAASGMTECAAALIILLLVLIALWIGRIF